MHSTLHLEEPWKRMSQVSETITTLSHALGRLFFINDRASHRKYLADTGAEVSVLPPISSDRLDNVSSLLAANDSVIKKIEGSSNWISVSGVTLHGSL